MSARHYFTPPVSPADGNPVLRAMTPMQARSALKLALRDDPAARERYARWCEDMEQEIKSFARVGYEKGRGR